PDDKPLSGAAAQARLAALLLGSEPGVRVRNEPCGVLLELAPDGSVGDKLREWELRVALFTQSLENALLDPVERRRLVVVTAPAGAVCEQAVVQFVGRDHTPTLEAV